MTIVGRPAENAALVDHVHLAIFHAIADLALSPGARVNIDEVARELGVSATPVREALARLAAEQLVRRRPRAGYVTVPLMSGDELAQLFALRLALEPWLAGCAADAIRAGVRLDVDAPDADSMTADIAFHDGIAALAGNVIARRVLSGLWAHVHVYRCYAQADASPSFSSEHAEVWDAVAAGDADRARVAMTRHLESAAKRVAKLAGA